MRPDPEPGDRVFLHKSQRSIPQAYANRKQIFVVMNPLKVQTQMARVLGPQFVTPAGLFFNDLRQLGKANQKVVRELRVHSWSKPPPLTQPVWMSSRTFVARSDN